MSGKPGAHAAPSPEPDTPRSGPGLPARYERRMPRRPTVSVVVPTYNERENIGELLDRLGLVLADIDHEIVVVDDDSPDRTWRMAEERAASNSRVTVLRRVGRRGLSSAVIDGMAVARGAVLAVIDADLQHDESVLPDLISAVIDDGADMCIGTRKAAGGSYGEFGRWRRFVSWVGDRLARVLLGVEVSDPMTGFFAVSRQRFDLVRSSLDPRGFKIALELMARGPRPTVAEVPFHFRPRAWGATKLTGSVVVAYLWSLTGLAVARRASRTASTYAAVAFTALSFRLSLLTMLVWVIPDLTASVVSFVAAGVFEFGLHRKLTFPASAADRWALVVGRFVVFLTISVHSTLALGGWMALLDKHPPPLDSGLGLTLTMTTTTLGIILAVVLSYVANASLTWPARSRHGATEVPDTRSDQGQRAEHDDTAKSLDQASLAKTSSTRADISVTALR